MAGRLYRLVLGGALPGALLAVAVLTLPKQLWRFPWFAGFMLLMAGISGICPMVLALRKIGFR